VSTFLAQARSRALRPMSGLPRPRLTVVARAATRAPRIPFVVLVVTLLVGGLVGLLLLNTALQRGAYKTTALRDHAEALSVRQQQLEIRVDAMAEPQRLAQRALRLGMVADARPGFLELATGKIIGTPAAGKRSNRVDVSGVGRNLAAGSLASPGHLGHLTRSGKTTSLPAGALNSLGTAPIVVPDPDKRHGKPNGPTKPVNGSGTQPGVQYGGEAQGPNR
jgi:hypothetical protein